MRSALLAIALLLGQQPGEPSRPGVIEGIVTHAVTGAPLKDATLSLVPPTGGAGSITAVTGDDGRFVLSNVPPGSRAVVATLPGFGNPRAIPGSLYSQGNYVTVRSGERVRNINIRLAPRIAAVSGRMLDANEEPASSVRVALVQKGFRSDGFIGTEVVGAATTDDRGEYRIFYVNPGEYYVRAEPPSGSPSYYPGVANIEDAGKIVVSTTELTGINFTYSRGARYAIRFKIAGLVPSPPSFTFRVRPRPPRIDTFGDIVTMPSRDEGYSIGELLPGSYELNIQWSEPAAPGSGARSVPVAAHSVPIDIADKGLDLGTIALPARPSFSGRVVFDGGTPIPGNATLQARDFDGRQASSAWTMDPDHTFTISNVSWGRYMVTTNALPADRYLAAVTLDGRDIRGREITISGNQGGRLELVIATSPGALSGVVRDAKGDPFSDASVVLVAADGREESTLTGLTATTDQNGGFTIPKVSPGDYRAYAFERAPTYAYRNAEWLKPYEALATRITIPRGLQTEATLRVIPRTP